MWSLYFLLIIPLISPVWSASPQASEEVDWVLELQRKDGAIPEAKKNPNGRTKVSPLYTNLALQNVLRVRTDTKVIDAVRAYIEWYFSKVNMPDRYGINGTIYEYYVDENNDVKSDDEEPNIDRTGASFMSLINLYLQASGDRRFVRQHLGLIKTIAESVWEVYDHDDRLTRPRPFASGELTINNLEVYKGHRDFGEFLNTLNDPETNDYREKTSLIRDGIEEHLWNSKEDEYQVENEKPPKKVDWSRFYPDVMSNIWGMINQLPDASSRRRRNILYRKFKQEHLEKWTKVELDEFPQTYICEIVWLNENSSNAKSILREFVENVRKKYFPKRDWPWYTTEAAWFSLCLDYLKM